VSEVHCPILGGEFDPNKRGRVTVKSDYIWYAIRNKHTGQFLPEPAGRNGRGGSHVEPGDGRPRLFPTHRGAFTCLRNWLAGKWVQGRGGYDYINNEYYEGEVSVVPVADRKKEDMEIVPFALSEIRASR
jgi:hypothetical protein